MLLQPLGARCVVLAAMLGLCGCAQQPPADSGEAPCILICAWVRDLAGRTDTVVPPVPVVSPKPVQAVRKPVHHRPIRRRPSHNDGAETPQGDNPPTPASDAPPAMVHEETLAKPEPAGSRTMPGSAPIETVTSRFMKPEANP